MSLMKKVAWIGPFLLVVSFSALTTKSEGIPYFARKYKTTCSRCHTVVPELNSFGKNFQMHGYQQPGDRELNKIKFPEDKHLLLPDQLPVAFLIENQVQADKIGGNNGASNAIASPTAFHIFAADTIAPDFGFFGELATSDGNMQVGKVSLTIAHLANQNLFVQVGNLDPTEHGVTEHDLFGRNGFAVQDIGLASANGYTLNSQHMGVRLYGLLGAAVTPALIHSKPPENAPSPPQQGPGGPSVQDTPAQKKDTGDQMDMREEADPLEQLKGFLWEVAVYNSTNSSTAGANPSPSDLQARLNMYFNGDSFIGIAAYSGLMTMDTGHTNRYQMAGPDLSFSFGKPFEKSKNMMVKPFQLLGGYLAGTASNPDGSNTKADWRGYFAQLQYLPSANTAAYLRYDRVTGTNLSLLQPTFTNALTANFTLYPMTNFWVGLEYTRDLSNLKQHQLGLVFSYAF